MQELEALENKLNALIENLSPQARTQLARTIARNLAQSQRQRIAQQRNPDGTAYAPRKQQHRNKKGRIKRQKMFAKLRTARFLRMKSNANEASIGFTGRGKAIAAVHQFGEKGIVNHKTGLKAQYAQRELLGFTQQEIEQIEMLIIEQLSN